MAGVASGTNQEVQINDNQPATVSTFSKKSAQSQLLIGYLNYFSCDFNMLPWSDPEHGKHHCSNRPSSFLGKSLFVYFLAVRRT